MSSKADAESSTSEVNEALLPDGLVQGSEVLELMLQMSNYVPSMHKQEGRVKDAVRGSQFRLYRFAHQVMGVDHLRLWEEDFRRRCGIDPLKEKEWLAYTTIWKEMSKDEYSPQNRYGAQARLPLESSSTAKGGTAKPSPAVSCTRSEIRAVCARILKNDIAVKEKKREQEMQRKEQEAKLASQQKRIMAPLSSADRKVITKSMASSVDYLKKKLASATKTYESFAGSTSDKEPIVITDDENDNGGADKTQEVEKGSVAVAARTKKDIGKVTKAGGKRKEVEVEVEVEVESQDEDDMALERTQPSRVPSPRKRTKF